MSSSRALKLPVWMIILLCSGLPLAWTIVQLARHPDVLQEMRLDSFRLTLLGRTLLYNGIAALIATIIALPAAFVIGRGKGWIARMLWLALPISLLLPSIIYAYGWSQFFRLLHIYFVPTSGGDIARCIWTIATWLWALPAAVIGLSLRRLDTQIQQQAMLDGALARITLRHLAAPIVAAFAMTAVLAVQEFAVYEPSGISVVATEVRMVFDTGAFSSSTNPINAPIAGGGWIAGGEDEQDQRRRYAAAVATTLPLLGVIALLCAAAAIAAWKFSGGEEIEVGPSPKILKPARWTKFAAIIVVIVAVIVPIASLILSLKVRHNSQYVWDEFSPQAGGALIIGGLTAIVALALAMFEAVRKTSLPLILAAITFLVGGQLLAISQIWLFNREWLSWFYNGAGIMLAAYIARFGWIALLAARSTWTKPWMNLRDLAALDGATPMQAARGVIWPIAWPALLAAALLVMTLAITEVPATLLLLPQRPQMLTPTLMTWVHMLRYDAMIEASLLLVLIVVALASVVMGLLFVNKRRPLKSLSTAAVACLFAVLNLSCKDNAKPQAVWCETGTGPAQVVYPRGISYSKSDDTFFIVDRVARIQHLDRDGKFIGGWRMPEFKTGKPVGLTVGPDGLIYVPDTHYQRVIVYRPDGTEVRRWGENGTGPGQFIFPTDIAFDAKGNVFVSEYGDNDRIQVFTKDGKNLYQFGKFGTGGGEFVRPQSMVIDGDTVYVTDACNHRICVFKTDGTFVRNMGNVGSQLGSFRFPYGLDMDSEGHLIVCEFGNNRVQMIDKETGRGIKAWGSAGHDLGQLAYPWAVAIDKRGRTVTVDAGNNRLQVFEF